MGMNKARIGFILGIIVALLIGTADIPGLARNGQILYGAFFYDRNFLGLSNHSAGLYFRSLFYYSSQFLGLKNLLSFFRPGLVQ